MNVRQYKKFLKKRITYLESDNDLMHRIIADSPKMQELYDLYNEPLNVTHTTIPFQEYKAKRIIPHYMTEVNGVVERTKQEVAKDLFEGIKDAIVYEVDTENYMSTVTASIFVGKDGGMI